MFELMVGALNLIVGLIDVGFKPLLLLIYCGVSIVAGFRLYGYEFVALFWICLVIGLIELMLVRFCLTF